MNIEHTKDDFPKMLPTLVHEIFHRLQVQIALADPTVAELGFDRITSYPFASMADRRLYQALCYIMLEGSATYVAEQGSPETWQEDVTAGLDILREVRSIDCSSEEESEFEELLTAGLRSNGPFYGLGALLSHAIVENGGPSSLGCALRCGAPGFIEQGVEAVDNALLSAAEELRAHVRCLRAEIESGGSQVS